MREDTMSKILVYSVEERTRESVKLILSDIYDLILTDSLEQCLEVIKNAEIRILLLDIDKQDKTAEIIKKVTSEKPDIKIVTLGWKEETVKSYGTDYITKPIKSDELFEICQE